MALRDIAAVSALCVALAGLCGCASLISLGKPVPGPFRHVSINQSDELITINEDNRLVIDLPYRAGYDWVVTRKPDSAVLTRFRHRPESEVIAHETMQLIYYYAVDPGLTTLELQQVPVKGSGPAIARFGLTVSVLGPHLES